MSPDAEDYLRLFAHYRGGGGQADFGRAYLAPEDERYRLLFEHVCRLLLKGSPFNQAMPKEFRRTARGYVDGDPGVTAHMRSAQMQHFMLSDLYDYVDLCSRVGQSGW